MIRPCGKRLPCTECCEAAYGLSPAAHPSPALHSHSGCSGDAPECSPICFFHRLFFHIAHPGKIDHQPFGGCSDVRIIAFPNIKLLLPIKYPCCISCGSLTETDRKKRRRHEIQREDIKLDADPQHERHPEDAAHDNTGLLLRKQQPGSGQVRETVYNQQCAPKLRSALRLASH